jgi:hypothetical protein
MDLPSRSEPCNKHEIKPAPLVSQFFLAIVQTFDICLGFVTDF